MNDWFKLKGIEKGRLQMGGFCLVVEFHCEGSATNGATPSRFLCVRTDLPFLGGEYSKVIRSLTKIVSLQLLESSIDAKSDKTFRYRDFSFLFECV